MLEVFWPDGRFYTRTLQPGEMNSVVEVTYPRGGDMAALPNGTQVGPQTHQTCSSSLSVSLSAFESSWQERIQS